MSDRTCSVPDCDRAHRAHGMCNMHYQRVIKHGDANYVNSRPKRNGVEPCEVDGCGRVSKAQSLCSKHYQRRFTRGDVNTVGRLDTCRVCGAEFRSMGGQVCCSKACAKTRRADRRRELYPTVWTPVPREPQVCTNCGGQYMADKRQRLYCSIACKQEDANRYMWKYTKAHRARQRDAFVESFDRREIFNRDGWVCGICGGGIDRELAYPDPMSASLDHVIPLAHDGEHSRANAQASHLVCNKRKNDRLTE